MLVHHVTHCERAATIRATQPILEVTFERAIRQHAAIPGWHSNLNDYLIVNTISPLWKLRVMKNGLWSLANVEFQDNNLNFLHSS